MTEFDWDELRREDMEKDALDDLMAMDVKCHNCGEEIPEDTVYYRIDNVDLCEECLNDCKRHT